MKYEVVLANKYRKSVKRLRVSGRFNEDRLQQVINTLARGERLDVKYQDHQLVGALEGHRECHVQPDLLLLYKIEKEVLILLLVNIGSHSDLFG